MPTDFPPNYNERVAADLQAEHPGLTALDVRRARQAALAKMRARFPEMPDGEVEGIEWLKSKAGSHDAD